MVRKKLDEAGLHKELVFMQFESDLSNIKKAVTGFRWTLDALDAVAAIVDEREWNAETLEAVAQVLRQQGKYKIKGK